jgi:hypothetical protein
MPYTSNLSVVLFFFLGLSPIAPLPAAAWFFHVFVWHFPPAGRKMTHKGLNSIGERKSYFC